jgi:hypothetical protein
MVNMCDFFHTLSDMVDLYELFRTLFYMVKNWVHAPKKFTHIYILGIILFSEKGCIIQKMFCMVELFELLVYRTTKEILREILIPLLVLAAILVSYILFYESSRYLYDLILK